MNTIEILYQVFRARYSLAGVQEALDEGYCLALISPEPSHLRTLHEWLGVQRVVAGEVESKPTEESKRPAGSRLLDLDASECNLENEELKECTAAVIHLGTEMPPREQLLKLAQSIPYNLPCLWVMESVPGLGNRQQEEGLPHIYRLDPLDPGSIFCRLLTRCFPGLAIGVARDFAQVRQVYAQYLIGRAARRNSMLAMASSVSVPPIPFVNVIWGFFATTGETMAITASQLRLCLVMAALHGRPIDFFDRVGELWPIIGGAFGWRTLARELIGFVPAAGWAMKGSLAYTGTWLVGEGSRLYYEHGQPTDAEMTREIKRLSRRAAQREMARSVDDLEEMVENLLPDGVDAGDQDA
jgi:uncharacterized protein (DUF697 family)